MSDIRHADFALGRALAVVLPITLALHPLPASAQARQDSSPDIVVEGKGRDDLKRVCKQTTATGSIIPTRTCKTRSEWEEIRERSIAQIEQLERDQVQARFTQTSKENCPTGLPGCD